MQNVLVNGHLYGPILGHGRQTSRGGRSDARSDVVVPSYGGPPADASSATCNFSVTNNTSILLWGRQVIKVCKMAIALTSKGIGLEPSRGVEVSIPIPTAWMPLAPVMPVIVPWADAFEASDARSARRTAVEGSIMKKV